jgi:quercetin dioxygenase-like cupin family protein
VHTQRPHRTQLSARPMIDEVDDPHSGQRVVFHRADGDVLEVDLFVSRGAFVRGHLHPSQEETFTCVTGSFERDVGGERRRLGPGDSVAIPARTRHGFEPAEDDAHLHVTVRPALELGDYFRTFLVLSRDARLRVPARGLPKPLLLFGVIMHRYRRDIAVPGVPLWLQRPLWWTSAWLGGVFGHRLDP